MKKIMISIIFIGLMFTGCNINFKTFEDPHLRLGIEKELKKQGLSFSDVDQLTSLDLSYLRIESLKGIEKLTNLESLNLSNNVLVSIEELSYLKKLRILDIQNNIIRDLIPISDLENLEILLIRNNDIEDITVLSDKYEGYLKTDFLVEVEFEDINLENAVKKQLNKIDETLNVNDINRLRILDLRGENVSSLKGLENAINIERLYIDSFVDKLEIIKGLKNIKQLTISNCEIDDLDFIKNFYKLEVLDLRNNKITDIKILSDFTNIKSLHLENNKIKDISPIKNYKLIDTLYLERNYIEDYNVLGDLLDRIKDTDIKLFFFYDENLDKAVRLAVNKESGILTLKDIENLKSLDASGSGIEHLGGIENMISLVSLNLSDNFIESINEVKSLGNLTILKLRNNKIEDISSLFYLEKIKILDLSFNEIKSIEPLIYLDSLEYLYLEDNEFENGELIEEMKNSLKGTDNW